MKLYREFTTQEEIDAAYNPLSTVADPDAMFRAWFERSASTAADLPCRLGMKYGPTCAEHCDVFPAGAGAPILVFVHGGYWRRFSARDHDFVAGPLVDAGITTVVMNYALCPSVTLDEIVRQTRASIAWAFSHAGEFGADRDRLTISGHSAGGHLVAMAAATDWAGEYDLPANMVKGVVAVSGLFDLGFVPYSYLQPKVQASWDQVRRLSPQRHLPQAALPLLVAVGGDEPAEFRRQSRDYHAALRGAGLASTYLEPPGKDHLTVLEELEQPESALSQALVRLAHGRGAGAAQ
jgi:arylformamidase